MSIFSNSFLVTILREHLVIFFSFFLYSLSGHFIINKLKPKQVVHGMTTIKDRPFAPQYTRNYIIKVKQTAVFISEMITNQENTRSKVLQQRPNINGSSNILRNKHYFECFPFVLGLMLKHTKYYILNVKKIQMQNLWWGMGLAPTICAILLHVHM